VVERSPEKAGVGGSTPSRGTINSTTYKPQNPEACSNLFQNSNSGPVEVCLSSTSLEAAVYEFASFLKAHFVEKMTAEPRVVKKAVLRLVRQELPPWRGRPNDSRLDTAAQIVGQGKSVKDALHILIRDFDQINVYGRYLAEKGLRSALARRRKNKQRFHPSGVG
jgi:hypothetical protein